jgi:hypothetical protein
MVRINSLSRSLLARLSLVVPFVAMTTVACAGSAEDPSTSTQDPQATEQANNVQTSPEGAAQGDDPVNGVASGSEKDDQGYAAAIAQNGEALAQDTSEDEPGDEFASRGDALLSTRGTSIYNEVKRETTNLNKSTSYYSHTTYMNESTYTRRTDCSGFMGYAINRVQPDAYAKVPHPNTYKPLADDWYNYLSTRYTTASTQSTPRWRRILKASDLKPGDLVVWLQPDGNTDENTGHLMMVSGYPYQGRTSEWIVPIMDSTTAPHASDSRGTTMTGVGTGKIGLKVNSEGKPYAYYWRGGLSYNAISTKIALGRLE